MQWEFCKCELFKHTHYALDDALETAHYYLGMKKLIQLSPNHSSSI